ncbi:hypothetical protein [Wenjunlia tyrosinilytica]|uniref:Uncharacterized protein n=1 Tax=Wenjunlia tyrosinilytica TaxID=1544741 RepID=A0A918E0D0_9ACTN|nr:hypothetical protein [Wenjunlia tyrosinilytica]GGO98162.1 hypothetical protein GCM10012280_61650 [Wenjunlia tyrosinilytica]
MAKEQKVATTEISAQLRVGGRVKEVKFVAHAQTAGQAQTALAQLKAAQERYADAARRAKGAPKGPEGAGLRNARDTAEAAVKTAARSLNTYGFRVAYAGDGSVTVSKSSVVD